MVHILPNTCADSSELSALQHNVLSLGGKISMNYRSARRPREIVLSGELATKQAMAGTTTITPEPPALLSPGKQQHTAGASVLASNASANAAATRARARSTQTVEAHIKRHGADADVVSGSWLRRCCEAEALVEVEPAEYVHLSAATLLELTARDGYDWCVPVILIVIQTKMMFLGYFDPDNGHVK